MKRRIALNGPASLQLKHRGIHSLFRTWEIYCKVLNLEKWKSEIAFICEKWSVIKQTCSQTNFSAPNFYK